jgi:hypothetical protein
MGSAVPFGFRVVVSVGVPPPSNKLNITSIEPDSEAVKGF